MPFTAVQRFIAVDLMQRTATILTTNLIELVQSERLKSRSMTANALRTAGKKEPALSLTLFPTVLRYE